MKVGKLNGKELIPLKGDRNETCDFNITHHLGMNYYVNFLGRLVTNGFQLK